MIKTKKCTQEKENSNKSMCCSWGIHKIIWGLKKKYYRIIPIKKTRKWNLSFHTSTNVLFSNY